MNIDVLKAIEEAKETKSLGLIGAEITDENWEKIAQLSELEELSLFEIKNTHIPERLSNLKSLKFVAIFGVQITKIPDFVLQLPELISLSISHTKITNFSDLKRLIRLEFLDLSGAEITDFSFLKNLTNLKSLNLNETKVTDFLFLKSLTNLSNLHLVGCKLSQIPIEIFSLTKLKRLKLIFNDIYTIPAKIVNLKNLMELDLRSNQIKEISLEINQLPDLHFPRLSHNPLNALQFGYIMLGENSKNIVRNLQVEIFNLFSNNEDATKSNQNFILGIDGKNYFFIEMLKSHDGFVSNHLSRGIKIEKSNLPIGFLIHVFGNKTTQIEKLNNVRRIIEQWIEEKEISYTSFNSDIETKNNTHCTRFFYFPPHPAQKENRSFINFEQLLDYKYLGKNTFSIENKGRLMEIPVDDLIKYIRAEDEKIYTEWKGSPFITKIEINDFKGFSKIDCRLEENINILIGRNGLGKTSFLQALTLNLLPISNIDKSDKFEKYISIEKKKSDIVLHWEKEYRKVYIFRNELKHERYVDIPQKLVLAYGTNLNTRPDLDHTKIVEQLINGNALSYSTKSIFEDYSTNFFDPVVLLEELFREKKGKEDKFIGSIMDLIKNTLNAYLDLFSEPEKITLEGEFANYYYLDLNKNKLKTNNLSEGYKDFILQITDIIVRIIAARNSIFEDKKVAISKKLFEEVKGIIIIDEFDRHLHPNLQRKFLSQLEADFKNIQFVMSTHNILSLQSGEGHTALILNTDGGLNIKTERIQKGLSIESIYNEYFGGKDEVFSYEIETLLKRFQELLKKQKDKITKAEAKEFKKITNELLSSSETVRGIVTREIRQFERLTNKLVEL